MPAIDPSSTIPLIAAGILGIVVGSFLNVVIRRLPLILMRRWQLESGEGGANEITTKPLSLALPPSHCFTCKHKLKAWHKIPVLGYLLLRRRCGFCQAPINAQYPIVELLTLFISVIVVGHFGVSLEGIVALLFSWTLIALSFIDYNEQLLPDELTLGLLWGGLIANAFGLFTDTGSAVLGAAAGYFALWLIYQGMRLATGREGLGYGDMKLLAAIGAWGGWQALPLVMLIASVTGLAIAAILLITRRMEKNEHIPFGPYLAAASWLCFINVFSYQWKFPAL